MPLDDDQINEAHGNPPIRTTSQNSVTSVTKRHNRMVTRNRVTHDDAPVTHKNDEVRHPAKPYGYADSADVDDANDAVSQPRSSRPTLGNP